MVIRLLRRATFVFCGVAATFFIAAADEKAPIQEIDGATRSKMLAAIGALIILGFALILLTWLGARFTRRYMNSSDKIEPKKSQFADFGVDDWASKPLVDSDETEDSDEN